MQRMQVMWTMVAVLAACGTSDDGGDDAADGGSTGGDDSTTVLESSADGLDDGVGGTTGPGPMTTTVGSTAADDQGDAPAPDECDLLRASYELALMDAQACDRAAEVDTCETSDTLTDWCGCQVAVDAASDDLADAQAAYDAWVGAEGCGPVGCGAPCPVGTAQCISGAAGSACGFGE
jgi:hypothetical protein